MSSTLKQNKYEIDMCNGTIMDKREQMVKQGLEGARAQESHRTGQLDSETEKR